MIYTPWDQFWRICRSKVGRSIQTSSKDSEGAASKSRMVICTCQKNPKPLNPTEDMYHIVGALFLSFTALVYCEGIIQGPQPPFFMGLRLAGRLVLVLV